MACIQRHGTHQSNIRISLAKTFTQLDGSHFDLGIQFTLLHCPFDQLQTGLSVNPYLTELDLGNNK